MPDHERSVTGDGSSGDSGEFGRDNFFCQKDFAAGFQSGQKDSFARTTSQRLRRQV